MKTWRPPSVLLVLILCCGWAPLAVAMDYTEREAELKALRESIDSLRDDLQAVTARHDRLQRELRQTEEQIGRAVANIRQLDAQLAERRRRLQGLEERRDTLDAQIADQRHHLARQVRAAYSMGRQEYVKILLNQDDPSAVGRVLTYYDYLNRARSERIATLNSDLLELEQVRVAIHEESERLTALRRQRIAERDGLEGSRRERNRLVERLAGEMSDKDQRLGDMLANEQELLALLRSLQALADIPADPGVARPFGEMRGKLNWPVEGRLLAGFGTPRSSGILQWQGVLLGAPAGREVRAIARGRVAFAEWLRGYGLLIIIDHGDGYMSLYGHNESVFKETGDWVEAGEVVAAVGNSGGQERTGLYFEIRHNGRPADPVRWCRR